MTLNTAIQYSHYSSILTVIYNKSTLCVCFYCCCWLLVCVCVCVCVLQKKFGRCIKYFDTIRPCSDPDFEDSNQLFIFCITFQLMTYHHSNFGYKRFSSFEDTVWTFFYLKQNDAQSVCAESTMLTDSEQTLIEIQNLCCDLDTAIQYFYFTKTTVNFTDFMSVRLTTKWYQNM